MQGRLCMETIGARICRLRKLFRLTQCQLADSVHLSDKVISKWENDESKPNLEDVTTLSQYFGISFDYLISGTITEWDKGILSRQPSREELITEAKANFIKQCNTIIRKNNLNKYKDKIFPDERCKDFLTADYSNIKKDYGDIGIFHPLVKKETESYEIAINLKAILAFDDYSLFEKVISLNFPFCDENEVICFFKYDKLLSDKDIHGLTDTRFYSFLSDQTILIKQSYERISSKERSFSFEKFMKSNSYKESYKKITSEALNRLESNNPNYWEIVKVLIEKGAFVQKMIGVHYGEHGDLRLHMDYADDIFVTKLLYESACAKSNK